MCKIGVWFKLPDCFCGDFSLRNDAAFLSFSQRTQLFSIRFIKTMYMYSREIVTNPFPDFAVIDYFTKHAVYKVCMSMCLLIA